MKRVGCRAKWVISRLIDVAMCPSGWCCEVACTLLAELFLFEWIDLVIRLLTVLHLKLQIPMLTLSLSEPLVSPLLVGLGSYYASRFVGIDKDPVPFSKLALHIELGKVA